MVRFLSLVVLWSGVVQAAEPPVPALLYGFPQMETVRQAVRAHDPSLATAYGRLLQNADSMLLDAPVAVTDKRPTDALGLVHDLHDYVSISTYAWPVAGNPSAAWQGRDGYPNLDVIRQYDDPRMNALRDRVKYLTLAWWFSGEVKYATAAVQQIHRWFIDPATRMNPNLNYAQIVPNANNNLGTQAGIIDGRKLVDVLSAVALLDHGGVFPAADRQALRAWFSQLQQWLLTDRRGIREGNADNNHAIYYDVQVLSYALVSGDRTRAEAMVSTFGEKRIATQVDIHGGLPRELARVGSGGYTCFALDGMIDVFALAGNAGIRSDLWAYSTADGRSWSKAMDFIKPYITGTPWPYGTQGFNPTQGVRLFRRAASDLGIAEDVVWARKINLATIDSELLIHYLPRVIPPTPAAPTASSLTSPTPVLSGTTSANAKIHIYDGGTLLRAVTADARGAWTWTVSPALAPGIHPLSITMTDATNSVSALSPATKITVPDTTAPPRPAAPTTSSLTSATPVLSGLTEASATITIYDRGNPLHTVVASASGTWRWTVTPALGQGQHVLTVTATDGAHNTSGISPATTITVPDTTPPATPLAPTASSLTSATPVLSGITEARATVKIYDDTTLLKTVIASATGAWTWTVSPALAQGNHDLSITATDTANNTSDMSPATRMTVPDTTPPSRPLAPTASSLTSANPVLYGTTEANAQVTLFDGATVMKTVTASPTGAWAWTVTPSLAAGAHNITVTITDTAHNTSIASPATRVTVPVIIAPDTTPPARPTAPAVSSITSPTPVVSGTTEAGATIMLFDNGQLMTTLVANGSGSWSWTVSPALAVGNHALTVMATDGAGHASAVSIATQVVVGDATPPATPAAPTTNSPTDDTPTLSGTTEPSATVTIYDGATRLKSVTANRLGSWSWTVTPGLSQGEHQLAVTATDLAGNVSGRSDTTAITVPDITPPAQPAPPAVSSLASAQPTLSGTVEAYATVVVYDGDTLVGTVSASATGVWTWIPEVALAEGIHALTVVARDGAGNTSLASDAVMITVRDGTPPVTPMAPTVDVSTSATPTLSGTSEANASIRVWIDGDIAGMVTADGAGAWSWTVTPSLDQGLHQVAVTATDEAGNVSGISAATMINVPDTTAPPAPAIAAVVHGSTGMPTLSGTAEALAVIVVREGGSTVGTTTASADGGWSWTASAVFSAGAHQLTVVAQDAAGNVSVSSVVSFTVTAGAQAPAPQLVGADAATPTLSGVADSGTVIRIFDGDVQVGSVTADGHGAWQWTPDRPLAAGVHAFTIVQVDAAGQVGLPSEVVRVTVPAAAPTAGSGNGGGGGCGSGSGGVALVLVGSWLVRLRRGWSVR